MKRSKLSRRDILRASLFGAGGLSLASLATGLPVSFLRSGGLAFAEGPSERNANDPTFLIIATSSAGDPLNANCPGSYPNPNDANDVATLIEHATVDELGAGAMGVMGGAEYGAADFAVGSLCRLGNVDTWAARPWADLPEALRNRMAVVRHRTYNNAHTEFRQVTEFHGALKGEGGVGVESMPSFLAQELHAALGTVVDKPMQIGGSSYAYRGSWLREQSPDSLQSVFATDGGTLSPTDYADLRDLALDSIYGDLSTYGSHAQKRFVEEHVKTRDDARALADSLSSTLAPIAGTDDDIEKQVIAAVALIEAKATPVVSLQFPFGGDNHQDSDLEVEVTEQIQGIEGIRRLWQELTAKGLEDRVTFAYLSVFGRTLRRQKNSGGRNHYGNDHAMVMFGPHVTPGLLGGVDEELKAGPIEDVPVEETLATAGKTLAKAAGVPLDVIEERIVGGKAF